LQFHRFYQLRRKFEIVNCKSKTKNDPTQPVFAFFATAIPQGDGSYVLRPGKPIAECGPREACKILGIARSSLSPLLDKPLASKTIKWHWLTEASGRGAKRIFDVGSLEAYRAQLKHGE
jgi:hypothetical protein